MTNTLRPGCYSPGLLFKPQWAYPTPEGYTDEPFLVPFSLSVLANGGLVSDLPVSLDDDVPYLLRAIVFPQIGVPSFGFGGFPGLVRVRDSHGNPITDGLILALGAYGQSGLENQNAFGFAIEPEIECAPGGTLLFDFQLNSTGGVSFVLDSSGFLTFFAAVFGAAGNGLSIELINPGAANVPLSVALVGSTVEVTLATNGASALISTLGQVANIINSTPAIAAVMQASVSPANSAVVAAALGVTALSTAASGSVQTIEGTLIGVKRRKECE